MMDVVDYADQLRRSWEWNKGRAVRRRKHHAESECFGSVARSFAKNSFGRHDRRCLFPVGLDFRQSLDLSSGCAAYKGLAIKSQQARRQALLSSI
jgi:hypothetical protein